MWDSGLIDEKLEFELSRDDGVLALSSGMNDTPYNGRLKRPGITSRPPPFHSSQSELVSIRHQVHISQYRSRFVECDCGLNRRYL